MLLVDTTAGQLGLCVLDLLTFVSLAAAAGAATAIAATLVLISTLAASPVIGMACCPCPANSRMSQERVCQWPQHAADA